MLQAPLRSRVSGWMFSVIVFGMAASLWLPPAVGKAVAVKLSRLQADADGMIKNAEEMVAHGGMGDTKAIVHHCGEVSKHAEVILKALPPTDLHGKEAQPYLWEAIKQCRRVAELGDRVDPGASLNPAIKARTAVREAVKHLAAVRESGA